MSMLRFLSLSPSRAGPSSPSASRRRTSRGIKVALRVPSYGSVFMPFPNPSPTPDTPRQDKELSGDLEIEIPAGSGRLRCKAIRVGVRTSCKLDMGLDRGHEEDTIWTGKAEVIGGTSEGVILEEGLQRFAFTIIIPANLATHDFHPGHRVDNTLFAEVEGVDETNHLTQLFRRSNVSSSSRGTSPSSYSSRSRSSSPHSSPIMTPPQSLTMMRQEFSLPQPPAYDLNDPAPQVEDIPWLSGTHHTERDLILLYNPDPAGGVNSLDARVDGDAEGLGPYAMTFVADEWCISANLKPKVALPAPSPKTTIYYVNVSLLQRADITSPRDGAKRSIERTFLITSYGTAPDPNGRIPKKDQPAIWRGKETGGDDDWELVVDGQGKLPNDYHGRPTTLQGVETPIQVSHCLRTEVWFSVKGEDAKGNPIKGDGPGELRVLRVDKHVIVPACFLIPEVLNLPTYRDHTIGCYLVGDERDVESESCPLCKTPAADQFCKTCPLTTIPHPRHEKLVGTSDGTCPSCTAWIIPNGSPMEWRACACGMSREEIIARMKRMSLCEREEAQEEEEVRGRRGREEKVEAERGRMLACGVDLQAE